jgi:hypothetical protein
MQSFANLPFDTAEQREVLLTPIEKIRLPAALDGSVFWAIPHKMFGTKGLKNDVEAIQCWLCEHKGKSMRNECLRAIEKLLLWCVIERGHSLAEFSPDELPMYCEFLSLVEPRHRWMDHLFRNRDQPLWRPFRAVVPAQSIGQNLTLCNSYFEWAGFLGLDMPHRPCPAMNRLITDKKSAYYRSGKVFTAPRLTMENWTALRQFLPAKDENYSELEKLVVLELMFYGGVTITHALTLVRQDFIAHRKADGSIGSWEFPAEIGRNCTVFSVGPLTASLSQLLGNRPTHALDLLSREALFSTREFGVRTMLAHAKKATSAHLSQLGLIDASQSVSMLTLARVRGGLMKDFNRRGIGVNLYLVFSWLYLQGYPTTSRYYDERSLDESLQRMNAAVKLSDWIEKIELDSRCHMLELQRFVGMRVST